MNYTVINYPLLVNDPSSPYLDKRSYVEYYDDLWNIQNPHVNLKVFCKETDTEYRITAVDPMIVNDVLIGNKVSEFEEVPRHASVGINYRGVFNGNPPEDPVNGDWYRNDVEGKTYIYQGDVSNGGKWIMMSKDGTNGKDGIDGKDGVDGVDGIDGINGKDGVDGSDGVDGINGVNGTKIEFVYCLSNSNTTPPKLYENYNISQTEDKYLPSVDSNYNRQDVDWTDNASGISQEYKYEWMSVRYWYPYTNVWTTFETPKLWSAYGNNGLDGGSVEYIYARTLHNEFPNEYFTPTEWVESDGYQQYDFVPDVKDEYNKPVWTDAPAGVDSLYKYEWISSRKLRLDEESESMVWGQFSTPTLWNYFVQDGLNLNLTLSQDNIIVIVDNDGVELDEDKRGTSTLGIYLGSKSIDATECDVDLESSITYVVPQFDADNSKITFDLPHSVSVFPEVTQITVTVTYVENDVTYTATKVLTITRIVSPSYEFYELNPSDSVVKRNAQGVETPSTVSATVYKYNTSGREEITTTEVKSAGLTTKYTLDDSSTLHNYDAGDEISCDSFDNKITFYLYQKINSIDTQIDKEVIELVTDGTSAEIPDWIMEWDGTVAQFNGENVLAVKAYVGDKPGTTAWTGLLIGSNVTDIKNSPWSEDGSYRFSGILAMTGANTTTINDFGNVTFALNSTTGDAYFKGTVIADNGKVDSCSIVNCDVIGNQNVGGNMTIGGFVKRSWKHITWYKPAENSDPKWFAFLNKLDEEGASFVFVHTPDDASIDLPSFEAIYDKETGVAPDYDSLVNLSQYLGSTIMIRNGNSDENSTLLVQADKPYSVGVNDFLILRCEFYTNNNIETLGFVGNLFTPEGIPLTNLVITPSSFYVQFYPGSDGDEVEEKLYPTAIGFPDNSTQLAYIEWEISDSATKCGATIDKRTGVVTIQSGDTTKYPGRTFTIWAHYGNITSNDVTVTVNRAY